MASCHLPILRLCMAFSSKEDHNCLHFARHVKNQKYCNGLHVIHYIFKKGPAGIIGNQHPD